jgi:hypothetical protein
LKKADTAVESVIDAKLVAGYPYTSLPPRPPLPAINFTNNNSSPLPLVQMSSDLVFYSIKMKNKIYDTQN